MINIRDLRIDPASLGRKKLLVDVLPAFEYKDGNKTDAVIGYRYIVALPSHNLEKIGIKIEGKQLIDKPTGYVEVDFEGLEVSLYERQGRPMVTARAKGISLVTKGA